MMHKVRRRVCIDQQNKRRVWLPLIDLHHKIVDIKIVAKRFVPFKPLQIIFQLRAVLFEVFIWKDKGV